ncbi:four-carbon acid sugar kinase family protein [Isoptericola sp. NPDC019482]|uniref:four-carbon acid sugar kinase family protein n=1 Tax=Isoptericola sp. NPDC019482 TaxID=3154688 RepID=UPI00349541E8
MLESDERLLILADDLSGAAEAAATLGVPASVELVTTEQDAVHAVHAVHAVRAVDLDCRYAPSDVAYRRTATALTVAPGTTTVLLKIDSLLRGNVEAQLRAALDSSRHPVVLAPALPEHGRTVVDDVPLVHGVPLAETRAWHIEDAEAPRRLRDVCPEPALHLGLAAVRGGGLTGALAAATLATCDAETTDDLARVAHAVAAAGGILVGASALARAWPGGRGARDDVSAPGGLRPPRRTPTLTVLGTAAPAVHRQVEHLDAAYPQTLVELPAADVARWADDPAASAATAVRVASALAAGHDVTVRLTDSGEPTDPRPLPLLLGGLVAQALAAAGTVDLVASGGETARATLLALGVRHLEVLAEVHPGAVLSRADTAAGMHVVTRPGGQGDDDSLVLARRALHGRRAGRATTSTDTATDILEKNR